MNAQFEEKQFEVPLALQLATGNHVYPPGQVLESKVGYDVALRTMHAAFWTLWGIAPPPGAVPAHHWWPQGHALPPLPPIALNLFVQCKRPEYMMRPTAKQWKRWNHPYYRYAIDTSQQQALLYCANGLGASGKVLYASPAFWMLADLFAHGGAGTLVQNCSFYEATLVGNHGVVTYAAAGTQAIALSKAEEIRPFLLDPDLPRQIGRARRRDRDPIQEADRAVQQASQEDHRFRRFRAEWMKRCEEAVSGYEVSDNETALPFVRTLTYCELTSLRWGLAG